MSPSTKARLVFRPKQTRSQAILEAELPASILLPESNQSETVVHAESNQSAPVTLPEPIATGKDPDTDAYRWSLIQKRFEEFNAKFPDVYDWLVAASRAQLRKGAKRLSIGRLYEQLRAKCRREKLTGEGYEFPNDFRSRYARKMMAENPDLAGKFEIRSLKS